MGVMLVTQQFCGGSKARDYIIEEDLVQETKRRRHYNQQTYCSSMPFDDDS